MLPSSSSWPKSHGTPGSISSPHREHLARPAATRGANSALILRWPHRIARYGGHSEQSAVAVPNHLPTATFILNRGGFQKGWVTTHRVALKSGGAYSVARAAAQWRAGTCAVSE